MAQAPVTNIHECDTEIESLKEKLKAAVEASKAESEQLNLITNDLQSEWMKMWQCGDLIKNDEKRNMFRKLLNINASLIQGNKYISAADDAGKVWFTQISNMSGDVVFMPKQDKDKKTPELTEMGNFMLEMQNDWMNEYFAHFDAGNEHRYKYNALSNKDSHK